MKTKDNWDCFVLIKIIVALSNFVIFKLKRKIRQILNDIYNKGERKQENKQKNLFLKVALNINIQMNFEKDIFFICFIPLPKKKNGKNIN